MSLYDAGQDRERRLVDEMVVGHLVWLEALASELHWPRPMCWFAVRIPFERLLVAHADEAELEGDVDVMGGPLAFSQEDCDQAITQARRDLAEVDAEWSARGFQYEVTPAQRQHAASARAGQELIWHGRMQWPPRFSAGFTAAEVKVAKFSADGRLQATQSGSVGKIRKQAARLCELGFDRVALIRALVTDPATAAGASPWASAGSAARRGARMRIRLGRSFLISARSPVERRPTPALAASACSSRRQTTRGWRTLTWPAVAGTSLTFSRARLPRSRCRHRIPS